MQRVNERHQRKYRTVWISDVHLGFRGCSAETLLSFLRSCNCERLYLVGDIVDLWAMKKKPYWPQEHNNVVRAILGKAKHGTKITFVPGNHDELFRSYDGIEFGNVRVANEIVHETADGRRLLVLHGDQFDSVVCWSPWLSKLGSTAYEWLLELNRVVSFFRRMLGLPYWSLAAYLKYKVKNAVQHISNFEECVAFEAKRQDVDGVVCGHIHRAEIREIDGRLYCNCGDWVESNTALVEHFDGRLELVHWGASARSANNRALSAAA